MSWAKLRLPLCWAAALALAVWGYVFFPRFLPPSLARSAGLAWYAANALQQVFVLALPALLILAARPARWARFRQGLQPVAFSTLACCFLLAVGGTVAVLLIASLWGDLLYALTGYMGAPRLLPVPQGLTEWALALAVIALTPALCEELFFRSLIQGVLRRRLPEAGIWLAAAIFAALHFQWDAFPGLLLVGAALGAVHVRYGYWAGAALHALYNGTALILAIGARGITLPMLAACCAACALALRLLLGKEKTNETDGSGL